MNAKNSMLRSALLAVLAAIPMAASAQTADLAVTLPALGEITYGQTATYKVKVTNAGPNTAQGVEMAFPTVDSHLQITNVTGCLLHPATVGGAIEPNNPASWPCQLGNVSDPLFNGTTIIAGSNQATVNVDVSWADFVATACPNTGPDAIVLGTTTVTVSTTQSTDPNLANNTATDTPVTGAIADIGISLVPNIGEGGPGTQFTVTGVVSNAGPCTAVNVFAVDNDGLSDTKMTFVSSTGCAEGTAEDPAFAGCTLGDIVAGGSATFTGTYIVGSMLSDELQRGTTVNIDVVTDTVDSNSANDFAAATVISKQDVSTCATGGIPTPLALLALGLLAFRRRRS